MSRAHVFYSGRVQGVGFRYAVRDIAADMDLRGWVKNLEDGRVEVVIEGKAKDLEGFLDKVLKSHLASCIKDTGLSWEDPSGEFNDFNIRF